MPRLVRDAEMAAAAPTLAISEAAPANETQPSRPRVIQESTNAKQQTQEVQTQSQQKPVSSNKPMEKVIIPPPPPGVPEIQLKMWSKTLSVRMHQLKQLSADHLSGLADEIRKDFMTSRHGKNEYSAALANVLRKSKDSSGGSSNGGDDTDLASGRYSSLYLQQAKEISPESIGRHFLALFYRSIDNRLAPAMSKHGLDALRKAFASLDRWRKKKLEDETSRERIRPVGEENDDIIDNDAKTARKEDEHLATSQELAPTKPAKPASEEVNVTTESLPVKPGMRAESNEEQLDQQEGAVVADKSGNADVVMEDSSSLVQTALRKGFSALFLRGKTNAELLALLSSSSVADTTTHHANASSSEATRTGANVSGRLNSTDADQPVQLDVSATKDTSGNADVLMEDSSSLVQTALRKGFSALFLRGKTNAELLALLSSSSVADTTTQHVSSSKAKAACANVSRRLSSTDADQPLQLDVSAIEDTSPSVVNIPAAINNKDLIDKEDAPNNDNEVPIVNQNPTQLAPHHHGNELERGNPSNHNVEGSDNKKMPGVSSESREREDNATALPSSDVGRPELRVNVENTSVEKSNPPAPNNCENKDNKTKEANNSNIPAGYRRRTVKKCIILDCPNKGGKCTLHGSLAKVCIVEGCEKFQVDGFEVCIKHGARNPYLRKDDECQSNAIIFSNNKEMPDVSSEARVREENTTTLSSSDVGRPELRVDVENTSVPMSNPPAPNNCENENDQTDAANDSTNTPVGYRRRNLRNCHIDDCPNKGGKCNLHGKLGKTCKFVGCENFRLHGFEVCVRHGARNPNIRKGKQSIDRLRHSSEDQAANQSQAAAKAPAEPPLPATNQYHASSANSPAETQTSLTNESQAASAKVPLAMPLKRESSGGLQSSTFTDRAQVKMNPTGNGEEEGGGTHRNSHVDELIDLTDDSPAKEPPPGELISSPPPSPPPTTIIRNPPPPTKPRPNPFTDFHRVLFCPDVLTERGTISGCVKNYARQEMLVEFDRGYHPDGSGGSMDNAQCNDVQKRLNNWDPYWTIIEELGRHEIPCGTGMTSVGTRTTACLSVTSNPIALGGKSIPSCGMVSIDFEQEISRSASASRDGKGRKVTGFRPWGVRWGWEKKPPDNYQLGDRRLIMRCIPLRRTAADEKKRADLHIWPRGSFVQIKLGNGYDQVIPVIQRKQQSHDHSKWLGNSRHLDLTKYITDTNYPLEIKICSKEVIEGVMDGLSEGLMNSYAVNVSVCEYTPPDDLYNQLMGKAEGEVLMPKLSLRSAKKMLKECIANNTISLDSDEEEDDGKESESEFLTFSLLCHASMKCIETPVRGQHCTHLQCFDLRNYLYTNNVVSAGRWKCPYCDNFVSVRDLVHCGLFQAILDDVDDKIEPGVRDKVRVNADGTWQLLGENKLRYKKSSSQAEAGASAAMNIEVIGSEGEGDGPEEIEVDIIEID